MKADRRMLVVAPNWLGDAVMSLPALGDIREAVAEGTLTVAARASVAPLFSLVPGVDDVVTLRAGRASVRPNAEALKAGRFDVAILFPNSFASAWMTNRAGIAERWGYRADWRTRWLTRSVPRPAGGHQTAYYRDLVRALGILPVREPPSIVISAEHQDAAREQLRVHGWDGVSPLIGIAPGAAYGKAKQWPPEYFAALIEDLQKRDGATIVLVGTRADDSCGRAIEGRVFGARRPGPGPRFVNMIAQTDLPALAAILTCCDAFVSNDSGAMHLAAALGVPVTAIFGPTNERDTAPRAPRGRPAPRLVIHDVFCRPCMLRECPIDHRCMRRIDPGEVAQACRESMTAVS